jgi:hypothetical protein
MSYIINKNISVCEEWYCYQNFAAWYYGYLNTLNNDPNIHYEIDKDILQWNKDVKIYSPATCALIPHELNTSIINSSTDKGLPVGVELYTDTIPNKYKASFNCKGKKIYLGLYATPEEAFEVYKEAKKKYLIELADYYYSINAIHIEIRDAIYNLELKPYIKGRIKYE